MSTHNMISQRNKKNIYLIPLLSGPMFLGNKRLNISCEWSVILLLCSSRAMKCYPYFL